jgi:hypothetical protein
MFSEKQNPYIMENQPRKLQETAVITFHVSWNALIILGYIILGAL